jgi:hypothetical protein
VWIGYLDRLDIVVRNDHARAALREMPESNGKVIFQTDASRVTPDAQARHDTGMQRYPGPGDALHVGHGAAL